MMRAPADEGGQGDFFLEDDQGDDLGDEEEEGDVDAHQAAEVPFGEVDEDAVGRKGAKSARRRRATRCFCGGRGG